MDLSVGPGLTGRLVTWWDAARGAPRHTVVAEASFALGSGLAVLTTPRRTHDDAPWKALADVVVIGAPAKTIPTLLGLSVARGAEVLLGKRTQHPEALGAVTDVALETTAEGWIIVPRDADPQLFQRAPEDQRMAYLRGGEQLLLVGLLQAPNAVTRLPALTAHAVADGKQLSLVGDGLTVDLTRGEITVTWRGVVEGSAPEAVAVSLLPLVPVEEVVGAPPRWGRGPRLREPKDRERVELVNDTPWVATSMCTMLAPDRWRCTVIAKGTYDIVAGAPATLADEQSPLWGDTLDDVGSLELCRASDLAPVKPQVDVLLHGHAYAKPGEGITLVTLVLGDVRKEVVALGERRWVAGALTDPLPFESLPLSYRHAFGGDDIATNRVGTGRPGTAPPRFELPDRWMRKPADTPPPAGFGPLHPSWQPRAAHWGTADDTWARERWPALPVDAKLSFFNAAPIDQRCDALVGDEPFAVSGVTAKGANLTGRLPGVSPGLFVQRADGEICAARASTRPT